MHRGLRGLGNLDPNTRSAMKRLSRDLRLASAAANRVTSINDSPSRAAERFGGQTGKFIFSTSINRPSSTYMSKAGIRSSIHFATDTGVFSAWTGSAWKTVTLT